MEKCSRPLSFYSSLVPLFLICVHPLGHTVTVLNGPVLAEDKDIGPNAVVKYRLLGARMDLFNVDANTGNTMTILHRERSLKQNC